MADNQSSYQQISQQNGSTFAQMIKKYDKEILSIPNLVELLKFSGKDAVGTLFFLDTLKMILKHLINILLYRQRSLILMRLWLSCLFKKLKKSEKWKVFIQNRPRWRRIF